MSVCVREKKTALLLAAGQDTTCFLLLLFFCHHHYRFLFDKKILLIIWQFIIRNDPLWIIARRVMLQYVNDPLVKCSLVNGCICLLISIFCYFENAVFLKVIQYVRQHGNQKIGFKLEITLYVFNCHIHSLLRNVVMLWLIYASVENQQWNWSCHVFPGEKITTKILTCCLGDLVVRIVTKYMQCPMFDSFFQIFVANCIPRLLTMFSCPLACQNNKITICPA